jgi:hypothetical protein
MQDSIELNLSLCIILKHGLDYQFVYVCSCCVKAMSARRKDAHLQELIIGLCVWLECPRGERTLVVYLFWVWVRLLWFLSMGSIIVLQVRSSVWFVTFNFHLILKNTLCTTLAFLFVSGFGFRVSGFGFRVSGFGFRVSGFGFRVSGFELPDDEICSGIYFIVNRTPTYIVHYHIIVTLFPIVRVKHTKEHPQGCKYCAFITGRWTTLICKKR